ncbi:MAG TPA: protein-L-isoaspartate(D-aspartate) O-methyltransferase [Deltaproteobacteria bacterium]|nr:protein-L-isoaspartate(D-aspartate) O-methyltransferase [Deltaproteobacteria bacterium]
MVETQLVSRGIGQPRVLDAMRTVPRHLFVDDALADSAYGDYPLPIGEGQTISQPFMVAFMTEALELTGPEKVLEVGTGSGYQTAVLSMLADRVFSIERKPRLAQRARRILDELQCTNVVIRIGDGTLGLPEEAPFDAIIVTAASPSIPPAYTEQLAEGGRLVIPVGEEFVQTLMRIRKENGRLVEEDLGACRFVKLIGRYGWKGR